MRDADRSYGSGDSIRLSPNDQCERSTCALFFWLQLYEQQRATASAAIADATAE
jgi:hypothetical protein